MIAILAFLGTVLSSAAVVVTATSDDEKYAAWCAWREAYEPDYSDSSELLGPPGMGRIAQPIRIAEDGRACAEIVLDDSPAVFIDNFFPTNVWNVELRQARGHERAVARFAARELAENLKRITGAKFPVVCKSEGKLPVRIFLGPTFAKAHFADDLAALSSGGSSDGFAVRVKDGDIYIFGARPAGTLYGVHAFIENNTDLIWAFPLPSDPEDEFDGTVFTARKTLDIVWADAREKPAFIERGWLGGEVTWMYHNRCNYCSRNRNRGFFSRGGGHYLSPQYYDHSAGIRDYNPVDEKGVRTASWCEYNRITCLTGKDFIRHVVETVPCVKTLRYNSGVSCIFGMDDTARHCVCETCRAPIASVDGRMLTPKDGDEFWCARFYDYINRLDDEIQKVYPGFETSTLAYYYAKKRPAIRLNKTIVPVFCCYWREDRANPVFAPTNVKWLELYKGWMLHSREIGMYDYYGLLGGRPYAEVYQRELQAQREIGFLRTSAEVSMQGDYLGWAEELWTMSRLMWNPDQDVERLHRYFNRRAYREAAPAMDRFRGTIRKAVFVADAADVKSPDFKGKNRNLKSIILAAGLKDELYACLDAAAKAAVHPVSRELVKRAKGSFDLLTGAVRPPEKDPLAKDEQKKHRPPLPDFENIRRMDVLTKEILPAIEKGTLATAEAAFAEFTRKAEVDDTRANGVQDYWTSPCYRTAEIIRRMADRFSAQEKYLANHRPEEGARLYDIWMDVDGDLLPVDYRLKRLEAKIAYLKANRMPLTEAEVQRRKLLERCAVEGADSRSRGRALLALGGSNAVDKVLFDRFMANDVRRDAALRVVEVHTADGKTDWKAAADHLFRAIADSDWSNLTRNCYSRQSSYDYRLDAVADFCTRAAKDGESKLALDLLARAEKLLGYDCDYRKVLEAENRTIPRTFERATAGEIGERYGKIRKLRDKLTGFAPKIESEDGIDEITLDE